MTCLDKLPNSFKMAVQSRCGNRCVLCGASNNLVLHCVSHYTMPASSGSNQPLPIHNVNGVVLTCTACQRKLKHNEENPYYGER